MEPRRKANLLWGLVGGLSFLVLIQGYELVAGLRLSFGLKLAVALGVAVAVVAVSSAIRPRLRGNERP